MKRLLESTKGMSLVELMVVLIVLSVGILPLTLVQTRSSTDVFNSGQRTEALNLGQMQMERVKALGFNNAVTDSGTVGVYTWDAQVLPAGLGLEQITVTVQWQEQGEPRSLQLSNVMSMR